MEPRNRAKRTTKDTRKGGFHGRKPEPDANMDMNQSLRSADLQELEMFRKHIGKEVFIALGPSEAIVAMLENIGESFVELTDARSSCEARTWFDRISDSIKMIKCGENPFNYTHLEDSTHHTSLILHKSQINYMVPVSDYE